MKIQEIGFSKADLIYIRDLAAASASALEDENGAAPPKTIESPPIANPDYLEYLDLARISNVAAIMHDQVDAYDTLNVSDTDPAVKIYCQAGGY